VPPTFLQTAAGSKTTGAETATIEAITFGTY